MSTLPSRRRSLANLIAATMMACALLVAVVGPALAHAELATASPGPDEVVTGSPAELVATFTEALDPSRSSVLVVAADGTTVAEGGADDVSADGLTMTVPLPELDAGAYEVRWTATATDGHVERGTYSFAVEAAPSPSPSPSPEPTASPEPSPSPSASPVASPSPDPSASTEPSPSAGPTEPAGDVDPVSIVLPILIVLVVVGILAVWWTRRRAA